MEINPNHEFLHHTTIATAALTVAKGLERYGLDADKLANEAGIDLKLAGSSDARVPIICLQRFWRIAVEQTGNPCFGLSLVDLMQPGIMQGLGFSWLASDTLEDAFNRLVRYCRMLSTAIEMEFTLTDDTYALHVNGPEKMHDFEYAAADATMAFFVQLSRNALNEKLNPVSVSMQRPEPPPACCEEMTGFFNAPISFSQTENILYFNQATLKQSLPYAHPELARVNDKVVMDYLARIDKDSITLKVQSHIIDLLPNGAPRQDNIAESLNMSLRKLQRKLQDENTNFKELLEDTRRSLAQSYIKQNNRSIGEITYLLGFSEPSNFTRAFKRWTGKTPASYRESA